MRRSTLTILKRIGEYVYRTKIPSWFAYLRIGHITYFSFLLTLINFVLILYKITLKNLNMSPMAKLILIVVIINTLAVIAIALGWLDMNAMSTRKQTEEMAYWTKPTWKNVAYPFLRVTPLPNLLMMYEYAKKHMGGEELERVKECISKMSREVIEWTYTSSKVDTHVPPYDPACVKLIFEKLMGIKLDEKTIKEMTETVRKGEYA